MNVTPELVSLYVDGELSGDEAEAVRAALEADPELAACADDFRAMAELFGEIEPEEPSREAMERLYALGQPAEVAGFEAVTVPAPRRFAWGTWAVAAAALIVAAVGLRSFFESPELELRDFARLAVGPDGSVTGLQRSERVVRRAGDVLEAGPGERLSFRTADGERVVLMAEGVLELGDPRDGELFELHRGTVLCTVPARSDPRAVRAAGYHVRSAETAYFGVRLQGADARPAGPAAPSRARVTVAVSLGSVEVGENGDRRTVRAYERVVLRRGAAAETDVAAGDPMYRDLMELFRPLTTEILPGYFDGEPGVVEIAARKWERAAPGRRVLTVTDEGAAAARASHLVLLVRASKAGPLRLTRLRPTGEEGQAESATVTTPEVGTAWTLIAVPRAAFGAVEPTLETIPAGRSRLVRFELAAEDEDTRVEIKASLWAPRAPADHPETER